MKIGNYTLKNEEKVRRVIDGSVSREGALVGGLGEDAKPADIIAHYDKIGGYIVNERGEKVKTGSFWNFAAKKPHAKPKPVLVYRINGKEVEVPEAEPAPIEIRAARVLAGQAEKGDEKAVQEAEKDAKKEADKAAKRKANLEKARAARIAKRQAAEAAKVGE